MRKKRLRRRRRWHPPEYTVPQILAWVDAFHERTGHWPKKLSGFIPGSLGEKWNNVDEALRNGYRGLPGGSSLAQLLSEKRGVRNPMRLPPLTIPDILRWADLHHQGTGKWPNYATGNVVDAPGETWIAIDSALRNGVRGLPGGSSLAIVLQEHRGVRNIMKLPHLTEEQIVRWADLHHERTGEWPNYATGNIVDAPGEKWLAVEAALRQGNRGLPGGSSLAQLLEQARGVRNIMNLPKLTIPTILKWADAHFKRTGSWPHATSGPIEDAPGETWKAVETALQKGFRGFPGGSSLAQVLQEHRGVRNMGKLPPLKRKQILAWADAYYQRTGHWPQATSGSVDEAPGETWMAVDAALHRGGRGLRGNTSLARLLAQHRGVRNRSRPPKLTRQQILAWADAHHRRTGEWPTNKSGPVVDAPGETWMAIDSALRLGSRGLRGGSSLYRLLRKQRGIAKRARATAAV